MASFEVVHTVNKLFETKINSIEILFEFKLEIWLKFGLKKFSSMFFLNWPFEMTKTPKFSSSIKITKNSILLATFEWNGNDKIMTKNVYYDQGVSHSLDIVPEPKQKMWCFQRGCPNFQSHFWTSTVLLHNFEIHLFSSVPILFWLDHTTFCNGR